MNNWREDAQPEWPEAASGTQTNPTAQGATQAFPETAGNRTAAPDAEATTVLPKVAEGSSEADLTELLSAFDRFDRTEALPRTAGRKAAGEAFTPRDGAARAVSRTTAPEGVARTTAPEAVSNTTALDAVGRTAAPATGARDPWGEAPEAGVAHDPHEVTIQLDGVGLQLDGSLRAAKGGPAGGGAEGSDGPVFVDESGRRSRRYRRLGMVVALACAVYAVVIVATVLSGNSNAPWLPVQDPRQDTPAGRVDTSPLPAESAPAGGAGGATPGASPSVSDGVTPSPGADATAPDASATTEEPGTGTDPEPTATKPTTPDLDPTPVDPDPTETGTTPDPDPTPTETGEPTSEPTPTEGGGDAGGAGTDAVAAENPAATPNDPSPEHTL
ncbi:hypothetical protein [Streptomyces sp. NPDC003635]